MSVGRYVGRSVSRSVSRYVGRSVRYCKFLTDYGDHDCWVCSFCGVKVVIARIIVLQSVGRQTNYDLEQKCQDIVPSFKRYLLSQISLPFFELLTK